MVPGDLPRRDARVDRLGLTSLNRRGASARGDLRKPRRGGDDDERGHSKPKVRTIAHLSGTHDDDLFPSPHGNNAPHVPSPAGARLCESSEFGPAKSCDFEVAVRGTCLTLDTLGGFRAARSGGWARIFCRSGEAGWQPLRGGVLPAACRRAIITRWRCPSLFSRKTSSTSSPHGRRRRRRGG